MTAVVPDSEPRIATDGVPVGVPVRLVASTKAPLMVGQEHHLCPGCGHPVAWRILMEVLSELALEQRAIGVIGHGCYTNIVQLGDIDFLQCLHGRAPAVATGVKRVHPQAAVFTLQGDGDMTSEGLQEVLHTAARGERVTCIMLNNGVFGDTGGQMTASTTIGQRTKTSLEGRDAERHGHPIPLARLLTQLEGVAYVARADVTSAGSIARAKKYLRAAFEIQTMGLGFSFVEILTMCPTGWFVPTAEGPDYLGSTLEQTFEMGVLKGERVD